MWSKLNRPKTQKSFIHGYIDLRGIMYWKSSKNLWFCCWVLTHVLFLDSMYLITCDIHQWIRLSLTILLFLNYSTFFYSCHNKKSLFVVNKIILPVQFIQFYSIKLVNNKNIVYTIPCSLIVSSLCRSFTTQKLSLFPWKTHLSHFLWVNSFWLN